MLEVMNSRPSGHEQNAVSIRALNMLSQISITESLGPLNLSEVVARRLESALSIGILNVGDRLPPEAVLAEYMGVSPLVLRHGLSLLRQRALIGTKRGRHGGSYIRGNVEIRDQDIDARLREISSDTLRDLYDTAAVLAAGSVRLAATRADHQDIERLRLHNKQVSEAQTGSAMRRGLSRFHISLGIAAQSWQLTSHLVGILVDLAPISWPESQVDVRKQEAYREREAVIAAIEAKEVAEAVNLMLDYSGSEQILAVQRHLELVTSEVRAREV